MRTCSQAHLPITHSSMSSEPVPIAHISEVVNIEEEIKPTVQDKSPLVPVDDLVSALRTFRNPSSKSGNVGRIKEPKTFTGRDPKKLKAFIFQCCLHFQGLSEFEDDSKRVTFALSYLWDIAQEWFKPRISGITDDYPEWLDSWDLFVEELQNNFGPFDESTDIEHELTNLQMKDSQHTSKCLIHFNSLAVHCSWDEAALRYRFYEGLLAQLKDEICKGDGKPNTLSKLHKKAQNIDAQYWEQNQCLATQKKTLLSNTTSNNSSSTAKSTTSSSGNTSQASGSKTGKSKEAPKTQSMKPDLTGKLDSHGKLTQQERLRHIDNNLCLFCGKPRHKVLDCPMKLASSAKGQASTAASTLAQGKDSTMESKNNEQFTYSSTEGGLHGDPLC